MVYSTDRGPGVGLTLCYFVVYSTRRFVLCLTLCYFILVVFRPFSIAITLTGEERANRSAFRMFVRFVLVWFCWLPLPLGVWEELLFVIVALPGLFSYLLFLAVIESLSRRGLAVIDGLDRRGLLERVGCHRQTE